MSKDGTVGFVGFGGLVGSPGSSNLGYVPMAAGTAEDVDATVDSEFRMVMRKLMKRDSVTKLKVLAMVQTKKIDLTYLLILIIKKLNSHQLTILFLKSSQPKIICNVGKIQ